MRCEACRCAFDATRIPVCPDCLVDLWLKARDFVRPKHDPRVLPLVWEGYRSVLNPNLVADPRPTLEFAARNGRWYRDRHYEMFVHFTHEPLGCSPGSGIPMGQSVPEHALDSLLIAEANSALEAHAFAVDFDQFEAQVRAGEFEPVGACDESGCDRLCVPGLSRCITHTTQAQPAREDTA
jgi:hypothetical protein